MREEKSSNSPESPKSMTSFATVEGTIATSWPLRLELKSLNHRFLDLKTKLPREFQSIENIVRKEIQRRLTRGAVEFRVDILDLPDQALPEYRANVSIAAHYFESLTNLQRTLGLSDVIQTRDLLAFPDVIERKTDDTFDARDSEAIWKVIEPLFHTLLDRFEETRQKEGRTHLHSIQSIHRSLQTTLERIQNRRKTTLEEMRTKIQQKVQAIFEAYPLADKQVQNVLDTRVAQELAFLVDRSDFEEERVRLAGHLGHFLDVLEQDGPVGRKLDFVIQEMHREINTLGNKAQDLQISHDTVEMKSLVEQLREQVMNLE